MTQPSVDFDTGLVDDRVFNFSAGPCCMPDEVLLQIKAELLNYNKTGMSVLEMSHRSKDFVNIFNQAEKDLRDVLSVPDHYKVLFLQGGATLQFSAIPLNLFGGQPARSHGDFLVTGQWGEKGYKECLKYGTASMVVNTKIGADRPYTRIPDSSEWKLSSDSNKVGFLHYTANETVNGVEFQSTPELGEEYCWTEGGNFKQRVPLVSDMSSNFMTKGIDCEKHAVIYAGAQKNIGPSGNCVVIADEQYLGEKELSICPTYCR